jgi:hypothetical protein
MLLAMLPMFDHGSSIPSPSVCPLPGVRFKEYKMPHSNVWAWICIFGQIIY